MEKETGVRVKVYGFDRGSGLPHMINDYRDHPDYWKPGDFPMDINRLRAKLQPRTQLILGDVEETTREFVESIQTSPIGFISFDLDLYSSTTHALTVLTHPQKRMLRQVPLYFDDVVESFVSHRFAGELLAIDEFKNGVKLSKLIGGEACNTGGRSPEKPISTRCISPMISTQSVRPSWRERPGGCRSKASCKRVVPAD